MASVEVLDALGRKLRSQTMSMDTGCNELVISDKPLASGAYIVRVHQDDFTQQTRVVQQ